MILSFHPCFTGDQNMLCAGRDPEDQELQAIKKARAVVLSQGCRQSLYEISRQNCLHIFPNYDAKFKHPGKTGQIRLFRKYKVPHPRTMIFKSTHACINPLWDYPLVFKLNWGGEGQTVFLIKNRPAWDKIIKKVLAYEKSGSRGFLIQEYIPGENRSLRVVIINTQAISYFRVGPQNSFQTSLSQGALLDFQSDPDLQKKAVTLTRQFCKQTKINLAGFDFIIQNHKPLFLEINYFFGRRGLGGSENYYSMLEKQINVWLTSL